MLEITFKKKFGEHWSRKCIADLQGKAAHCIHMGFSDAEIS